MKPYEKFIIFVIIGLGLYNYVPPMLTYFKHEPKVKRGQIWQTNTKTLYFMDNVQSGELTSMSFKLVLKVENDSVYYVCNTQNNFVYLPKDTFVDDIDGFTFSSESWKTSKIDEIN